ncbi:hypothetical protein DFH06DRAFT_112713 [Mycena polygramma]|nr:hypothetical protein DFH06DRAFT_112713 [Mycena polygramma]
MQVIHAAPRLRSISAGSWRRAMCSVERMTSWNEEHAARQLQEGNDSGRRESGSDVATLVYIRWSDKIVVSLFDSCWGPVQERDKLSGQFIPIERALRPFALAGMCVGYFEGFNRIATLEDLSLQKRMPNGEMAQHRMRLRQSSQTMNTINYARSKLARPPPVRTPSALKTRPQCLPSVLDEPRRPKGIPLCHAIIIKSKLLSDTRRGYVVVCFSNCALPRPPNLVPLGTMQPSTIGQAEPSPSAIAVAVHRIKVYRRAANTLDF